MKTQDEILEHIAEPGDLLGFTREALAAFLDYEHVKPLLNEGTKEADWTPLPLTRDAVLEEMRDYMKFAWTKVEDHRGISASRSVEKMEAWLWLLDDPATLSEVRDASYAQYGAPQLAIICKRYDFPIPASPGVSNMIQGKPCTPDCYEGCGLL